MESSAKRLNGHQNGRQDDKKKYNSNGWSNTSLKTSTTTHNNEVPRYKRKLDSQSQVHFSTTQRFVPSLGYDIRRGGGYSNGTSISSGYAYKSLSLRESCSKCLPDSRGEFIDKEYSGAGLKDLLVVERGSVSGILGRLAPLLSWTLQLQLRPLVNPKREALNSPRVQAAIDESAKLSLAGMDINSSFKEKGQKIPSVSEEVALREQKERAWSILNTMSGPVYSWFVKLANYTMLWILGRMFHHFYVQRSHVRMLHIAQEKDVPMIFLPCHKSHIDYMIVSVALVSLGIKMPHIAAGDNLNIPIFNSIIRHLGGYFIRRKLDLGTNRDILYRECLQEYIEQLIKSNQNVEIFIEGSRSRSGKPSLPKSGLLSFLVEAVREGTVSDVLLVPVGIAYDRIVEKNFVRHELMGGNKKPENLLKALGGVWRMLTSDVGSVRLDFGQPFSLQEYLNSLQISNFSLMNFITPFPSSPNSSRRSSTDRRIITALSHHIVFDFTQTSTIMSTNIIGFLLLTKYRQGAKISHLVASYKEIADRVTIHGRALGFSGSPSEAVHYALKYLSHIITYTNPVAMGNTSVARGNNLEADKIIRPLMRLPDIFQLSHHSNQLIILFMKEALIGCSIIALQECEKRKKDNKNEEETLTADTSGALNRNTPELISQEDLIDYALDLTRLIGREFIFAPPCMDVTVALYEGIESLITAEVLKIPTIEQSGPSVTRTTSGSNTTWEDDDDSEEDQQDILLEVVSTQQARAHVSFLQSVLGPFIEGYWNVAIKLLSVWEDQQNKKDCPNETQFLQELQQSMIASEREGKLLCLECCSMDVLRNGLRSFISLQMVTVSQDKEGQLLVIDHTQLIEYIELLAACKI